MLLSGRRLRGLAGFILEVTDGKEDDLVKLTEEDEKNVRIVLENLGIGKGSARSHEQVLAMYFGLWGNRPHSMAEIGQEYAVDQRSIRFQIEKSMEKLRHPSRSSAFLRLHRSQLEQWLEDRDRRIKKLKDKLMSAEEEMTGEKAIDPEILEKKVDELNLSVKVINCLKKSGINTVGELIGNSAHELLLKRQFGQKTLVEVRAALYVVGLELRM